MLLRSISIMRDPRELRVEADIDLPDEFGDSLEVSANQLIMDGVEDSWRLYAEADALNLAGLSRIQPVGLPGIKSGTLDLSIWMELAFGGLQSATANVRVEDLLADTEDAVSPFSLQGSFEYSAELDGWFAGGQPVASRYGGTQLAAISVSDSHHRSTRRRCIGSARQFRLL